MNAKDLMTAPAITITPNTPVHEIAELPLERARQLREVACEQGE